MKNFVVLFDIIHPANVHYFKHTIRLLKTKGCKVVVTARHKEITYELLDAEELSYIKMGRNPLSTFGKVLFLFWCEFKTLFVFFRYRPSIALSFGASYIAHNSFLFGVPHIALDDTEHASLNRKLYLPFTKMVLTPESYYLNLGKKHVRFPGHMELFYLSKKYFNPDDSILIQLGINKEQPFVFLRFVSWSAHHDKGQSGISNDFKIRLVKHLSERFKVFISSEGDMPDILEEYRISVPPHLIHHVLYFSKFFVGEGATMASECAAIGTPAVYINSLNAGTLENQVKEGLIYSFRNETGVQSIIDEISNNPYAKRELADRLKKLEEERIDLPRFLAWLILNYPDSHNVINSTANWQNRFQLK